MTTDSGLRPVVVVLAALVSIPLFMMGIVMPLLGLTGLAGMSGGHGGVWMFFMPVIPLVLLGTLGYVLVRSTRGENGGRTALDELRSAYARGELSDEEFEARRDRLQASRNADKGDR